MLDFSDQAHGEERLSARLTERVLATACLLLFLLLALVLLCFPYGADQAIFALIARGLLAGQTLYVDVWDVKPPGTFLFYMLSQALFGTSTHGIRILELGCHVAFGVGSFFLLRRQTSYLSSLIAATLVLHAAVLSGYWHTAQSEVFVGFLLFGAMALLYPELQSGSPKPPPEARGRILIAGLAVGLCGLIKPFYVLPGLICLGWACVAHRRGHGTSEAVRAGAWGALGIIALPALVFGILALQGGIPAFLETFFGVAVELAKAGFGGMAFGDTFFQVIRYVFLYFPPPLLIGLFAYLYLHGSSSAPDGRFLALFLLSMILVIAIQGKFYPYHYQVMLPVLGFLAALGWWELLQRCPGGIKRLALALGLFASFFVSSWEDYQRNGSWTRTAGEVISSLFIDGQGADEIQAFDTWPSSRQDLREVSALIRNNTRPEDQIQVLGFDPLVYIDSGRDCATRFLSTTPIRLSALQDKWTPRLIAEMEANPPAALIVPLNDRMGWTLDNNLSSAEVLEQSPALQAFVATKYELLHESDAHMVFVRRRP
ncbi:MAG: hypothetical protein PWP23_421 [Candidatus Sumerlaeota bacterium]|nr:hypothetical protein [Candidatus Sumerlaeota bacterium]